MIGQLTADVRDIVEAVHGRGKPHVAVILIQVVCTDDSIGWKAQVKRGRAAIAKCCETHAHLSPADALEELASSARRALGVSR